MSITHLSGMQIKYQLEEEQIPKRWYNIQADLPTPLDPVYSPQTLKPVTPRSST